MKKQRLSSFMHRIYRISGKIHQIRNAEIPLKTNVRVNSAALSTLDVISKNPTLNMSEISMKMGLTKGAISQMALKLQQKELLQKCKSEENGRETYLQVTKQGKQVLEEYDILHSRLYQGISNILMQYQESEIEVITGFLEKTDEFLDFYKQSVGQTLHSDVWNQNAVAETECGQCVKGRDRDVK